MVCPVKSRNGNILRAEKAAEPPRGARSGAFFIVICRRKAADEMKFENNLVFCVLMVLTGSSQTRGESNASPPVLTLPALPGPAGTSASPDLTEDPGKEVPQQTHDPAGRDETSTQTTTVTKTEGTLPTETATNAVFETNLLTTSSFDRAVATSQHTDVPVLMTAHPGTPSPSAAADSLSSTPTVPRHTSTPEGSVLLTRDPLATLSSQPGHTVPVTSSTAHPSAPRPQSESPTTATATTAGLPLTSAPGRGPAGPTHQEVPSELNVGDEDFKGPRYRSSSPLDPLLAGLLSVFIVTTAIVFVILFLKFRQRTNHPEFHRLQDLPMDDLMEDTPLSRYTY